MQHKQQKPMNDAVCKAVLDEIQGGFPLELDPYGVLAERLGLSREDVLGAVAALRADGSIRKITASLSSRHLGYFASLCALAAPGDEDAVDRVAALVSAHPEITHNYLRDDRYNIWFTAIARDKDDLTRLLAEIREETGVDDLLNLPATALYKIRVDFGKGHGASDASASKTAQAEVACAGDGDDEGPLADAAGKTEALAGGTAESGGEGDGSRAGETAESGGEGGAILASAVMEDEEEDGEVLADAVADDDPGKNAAPFNADDPLDIALVHWAQGDATGADPFEDAAAFVTRETGQDVDAQCIVGRLRAWKACGVLRRYGAMVQHRKLGFLFNGMTVWDVDADRVDEVGARFAELPFVSHCYARVRTEQWPYNLYGMAHAQTQEELDAHVDEMRRISGLKPKVLVSSKEYKKMLPVYFTS